MTITTGRPTDGSHLPIIHSNGSGKRNLLDWLGEARHAIRQGTEKLAEATPNGRDYYPVPGRMEVALAEHQRRMEVLRQLQRDIEADMEAILDA